MFEAFIEVLDGLFFEGYAEQLSKDNPEQFDYELNYFYSNYSN